jgi:hypothetical protein
MRRTQRSVNVSPPIKNGSYQANVAAMDLFSSGIIAAGIKLTAPLIDADFPVLKSLFGGNAKWQSPNADDRLTAVSEMAADDANLKTLATSDPDAHVRTAAVTRVTDIATLKRGMDDADAGVREAAAKAWAGALGGAITADLPLPVVAAAIKEDSPIEVKAIASKLASGDLAGWLTSSAPLSLKLDAINATSDVALLDKLHLFWRDHDKRLGKACHERVVSLQSGAQAAQEADVLLAQMETWSAADEVPLTKLMEAQRAWAKLTVDDERKARFEKMNAALQAKMQNESQSRRLHEALAMQIAGLTLKSKRVGELNADDLRALATEATTAQSSPVLDAALAQQLQGVHAAIAAEQQLREKNTAGEELLSSMPAYPGAGPKKKREPKKVENVTTPPLNEGEAEEVMITEAVVVAATEPEVATPSAAAAPATEPELAESAAGAAVSAAGTTEAAAEIPPAVEAAASDMGAAADSSKDEAFEAELAAHAAKLETYKLAQTEWKAKWDAWLSTVDAATKEKFEKRLAALEKPAKEAKPERVATARADEADITKANESLTKLAELIAAGDVRGSRSAASALYKAFTAKRYPKPEESRLHELDGEVKRLESWLKWSDGQARDGLFARLEALKTTPLPPDALAKEIRTIQDEWKALDKKNGGAPKPKWDKFNALAKEAYAPAKAHFDALRKQRGENAQGREKVIADMQKLADEASAPIVEGEKRDWLALEKRKLDLFDAWKKAGSVNNATWKALDEKFDVPLKQLDNALDAARAPELARRKKLIARAEELAKATPSRETTEATIAIQRQWAAERIPGVPHLRRKDEQKLWDEFKKHTDAVFKARDTQRDAMKAQFSEATKARFEVIDEVKALANGDDAKAIEAAIGAARNKWRNLPLADRDKGRDLDRKFDDAVIAARRRATVLSRGSVIEAMKATLEKIAATESADKTAAGLVIDAELIAGIDSPAEIATARRMQQLKWLSERRQLPTAPDAKIQAVRTLLGAFNATGAKITLGERERLVRAIEAVGAA